MVCSLFLDSGDWVVAEEFTYPQLLECQLAPRGCHVLPVPMDGSGMLPAELERVSERAG
jgi:DNA-binding transcriptional MocR family regulator